LATHWFVADGARLAISSPVHHHRRCSSPACKHAIATPFRFAFSDPFSSYCLRDVLPTVVDSSLLGFVPVQRRELGGPGYPGLCLPSNFPSRTFSVPQGLTSHHTVVALFHATATRRVLAFRAFPVLAAATVSGPLPSCHCEITKAADVGSGCGRSPRRTSTLRGPVPRGTFSVDYRSGPPISAVAASSRCPGSAFALASGDRRAVRSCRYPRRALRIALLPDVIQPDGEPSTTKERSGCAAVGAHPSATALGSAFPCRVQAPRSRWLQGFAPPERPFGPIFVGPPMLSWRFLLLQGRYFLRPSHMSNVAQ